eukprot:1873266-Rhodomonas_salina.2
MRRLAGCEQAQAEASAGRLRLAQLALERCVRRAALLCVYSRCCYVPLRAHAASSHHAPSRFVMRLFALSSLLSASSPHAPLIRLHAPLRALICLFMRRFAPCASSLTQRFGFRARKVEVDLRAEVQMLHQ